MSDQMPESSPIRAAVASVVCNATNWPDRVFTRMLGVDLTVPIDRITAAVRQAYEAELAAAKAEVLREAAAEFRNCPDWPYRATRPTATEDYLIARADKLVTE